MAFTCNLSTTIGMVRLYLCDTREETAFFTDEELQALVTAHGTAELATAAAARICLMQVARFARSFTGPDGASVDETATAAYLQDLITRYGGAALMPTVSIQRAAPSPQDWTYYQSGRRITGV